MLSLRHRKPILAHLVPEWPEEYSFVWPYERYASHPVEATFRMVWAEYIGPLLNAAKELGCNLGIIAAIVSTTAASGAGVFPRAGPGRALTLALRSKIRSASPLSQRTAAVNNLLTKMNNLNKDRYVVVLGPISIGKTCVVETATQYTCGVVNVDVPPGATSRSIIQNSLMEVTNVCLPFLTVYTRARRVLFWYGLCHTVCLINERP